jgi:hypothetical protein
MVAKVAWQIGSLIRKVKTELMKADTQRINNNENALFALRDFSYGLSASRLKASIRAGLK